MSEAQPREGTRWFLIAVCSLVVAVVAWPAWYILMSISPIPVTLFTTGLPASVITGGAFVIVGQYVSKHRTCFTSRTLAIVFTVLAGLMLLLASGATRPGEYLVMGIFGPVGAWLAHLKMSPEISRMKRDEKSANN